MRQFGIALLFALGAGLLPAALALTPKASSPVAVIAAPWAMPGEAMRIAADADGFILSATRDGRVAIARARASTDDFVVKLYRAGAVIVLDGEMVSACFSPDRGVDTSSTRAPT